MSDYQLRQRGDILIKVHGEFVTIPNSASDATRNASGCRVSDVLRQCIKTEEHYLDLMTRLLNLPREHVEFLVKLGTDIREGHGLTYQVGDGVEVIADRPSYFWQGMKGRVVEAAESVKRVRIEFDETTVPEGRNSNEWEQRVVANFSEIKLISR